MVGNSSGTPRVSAIEGVRAYLALWVLACHAMWYSGYEESALGTIPRLILSGYYAVDVFIIISGFVIFFLLDTRKQTYGAFVCQRFFRLFPLFITLFVAGVALYKVQAWNLRHIPWFSPDRTAFSEANLAAWTDHLAANVALHATMLHGLVPDSAWRDAPGAFLVPAWSISLEWQFYLLAPLAYALACRRGAMELAATCLGLYVAAIYLLPWVRYGAFLPFHIEYFFIGAASYFLCKCVSATKPSPNAWFSASIIVAATIWFTARQWAQIPLLIWILFGGLMLEPRGSISAWLLMPLFENRVTQYLGKISYSIYLSHFLVLAGIQYALLHNFPDLTQQEHAIMLFAFVAVVTIALSGVLYRWIEAPGIALGKRMSARLTRAGLTIRPSRACRRPGASSSQAAPPSSGRIPRG